MFMENHQQKMIFSDWWFGAWILFSILYMGCHPNPIDELILFKMVFQPPSSFSCRLPVRFFPAYSSGTFSLFPFFFPLPDSGNQSTRSRGVAKQVPGTGYRGVTVSSNPWRFKELLEGTIFHGINHDEAIEFLLKNVLKPSETFKTMGLHGILLDKNIKEPLNQP